MLAQLPARVKHACLHRSDGRAGHFCDFQHRMPHVTGKFKSQALLVGKTIEAMHHPVPYFSLQRRIDGLFLTVVEALGDGVFFC